MKLEDVATGTWMAAAAAFGALALKVLQWSTRMIAAARKTDVEFGRELRDELWKEVSRLRAEVNTLRDRADDADQRALDCQAENGRLKERIDDLEARSSP